MVKLKNCMTKWCSFFIKLRKLSQSEEVITNRHVTGGSKRSLHTRKSSNPYIKNNYYVVGLLIYFFTKLFNEPAKDSIAGYAEKLLLKKLLLIVLTCWEKNTCCEIWKKQSRDNPANIYLLKVNIKNTRTMCDFVQS